MFKYLYSDRRISRNLRIVYEICSFNRIDCPFPCLDVIKKTRSQSPQDEKATLEDHSLITDLLENQMISTQMASRGTVVFTTIGRPFYGFDIFTVILPENLNAVTEWKERRLTDGKSINYNGQFTGEDDSVVYVSERGGDVKIFQNRITETCGVFQLPAVPESHFHDRPIIKNGRLFFVSNHEPADKPIKSCSAIYCTDLGGGKTTRLTPPGAVDYSPAISQTGKLIAAASYCFGQWNGDFHELSTDVVVFREANPNQRFVLSRGGWPTFSGDSTVFFHRKANDGWWSVFRADLPENIEGSPGISEPQRITPPGLHAFTPAASHSGKWIAVATRRPGNMFRHIEIFDLKSNSLIRVTEFVNPNFHHYNPFVSPESGSLGYHRFRGESAVGDSVAPYLEPVLSPLRDLRLLRTNGSFPSFSPDGDLIAVNPPNRNAAYSVRILKSDGTKHWNVLKDRIAFYNAWSPTEKGVIYTSIGPIFDSVKATVQIARITFDPADLDDRDEIPAEVKFLTKEDTGNNAFPSCSPDGKFLVFRSGRSGHKNLYIMDAVKGEEEEIRQLTNGAWIDTMPSWSPDGKMIAFSSNRHNPENTESFSIYLVCPDGTGLRRVYVAGSEGSADVDRERINHVCFSPDSKWLLFTANLCGVSAEPVSLPNQFQPYGELLIVRLDGSGLERLTWNAYEDGTPAWHSRDAYGIGSLASEDMGDKLTGQFDEPLWIT